MTGAGNDYIYIVCPEGVIPAFSGNEVVDAAIAPEMLAVEISDRHFGVGSDGLVLVIPGGKEADFRMRMFNNDGSEAQMCGNATRCIGRLVRELGLTDKNVVTLATKAGIKTIYIKSSDDGEIESIEVDMGQPVLDAEKVPARGFSTLACCGANTVTRRDAPASEDPTGEDPASEDNNTRYSVVRLKDGDREFKAACVSMGNPHGVIFLPEGTEADDELVLKSGPKFETADCWPEKANIEFIRKEAPGKFVGRVWERGSGETLACGTGACAVFAAAVAAGHHDPSQPAEIRLPGGTLTVRRDETGHLLLSGPTAIICSGDYHLKM